MIHLDSFFDAPRATSSLMPRTRKRLKRPSMAENNIVTIPKFYIHH
jgi:hypothetical protein